MRRVKMTEAIKSITVTKDKQWYVYYGMRDSIIRWVGSGQLLRIQEAINGNHTANIRWGCEFDSVEIQLQALTKDVALEKERQLIELMGIQLINKNHNPHKGIPARKALGLPMSVEDREAAGLVTGV
tara:strand:+ start:29 stop:409 length:381 start_codon:yes stop_codon:yes gene_type:complete